MVILTNNMLYLGMEVKEVKEEVLNVRKIMIKRYIDTATKEQVEAFEELIDSFIPYDDEPLTEEEIKAIEEGERQIANGEFVSLEDILRENEL